MLSVESFRPREMSLGMDKLLHFAIVILGAAVLKVAIQV